MTVMTVVDPTVGRLSMRVEEGFRIRQLRYWIVQIAPDLIVRDEKGKVHPARGIDCRVPNGKGGTTIVRRTSPRTALVLDPDAERLST